ncbi:putative peptidase C19 family protein [Lyophyllum shimeji]|uniref:ubiquitinyl hydrolase 1 n=1 Tax=Lyophyllum shimeji TaxID=47721 RepID=A0A9P3UQ79_LYOSH|nr:putative peptidase C19 family protein [Lyophyllum shimeji]
MQKARWRFGLPTSQVQQEVVKPVPVPAGSSADAKKFGLENFCNNCYVNAVVQALYFCQPFRDLMLQTVDPSIVPLTAPTAPATTPTASPTPLVPVRRKPERKQSTSAVDVPLPPVAPIPSSPPSLFSALRSLFLYISTHPNERGTVAPRAFVEKLKEVNQIFNTTTHQDAHEFLNYLLNKIMEEVEEERRALAHTEAPTDDLSNSVTTLPSKTPTIDSNSGYPQQHATLVHKLFEGVLTSETRCLTCETVSSRDESFLDLSIDIEQNSSVTACLRQFSASEMLCHKNKFFCDSCCDLQEAEKRMKIKRLPNILALHLKRFKYQEDLQKYVKLAYRVAFPFELRLFNTVDEMDDADRLYNLFGIVVHIGSRPDHGHYVSIIKTLGSWLLFDDDTVSPIPESDIPKYFGDSAAGCAYVLYYQAADIDTEKLGLRPAHSSTDTTTTASVASQPSQTPTRPPGLIPQDAAANAVPIPAAVHTAATSSTSDVDPVLMPPPPPPSSFQPPHLHPSSTSTSLPNFVSNTPSTPSSSLTVSTSTSHSHPQSSSPTAPPAPPALAGSVSAPPPPPPSKGVSGLFKTIRKSPSISIRTHSASSGNNASASTSASASASAMTPTAATGSESGAGYTHDPSVPVSTPQVPQTPTSSSTEVTMNGSAVPLPLPPLLPQVHSPRQLLASTSGSGSNGGRPATAHHPAAPTSSRALPMPPRPGTSGHAGGGEREREGEQGRDGGKEKERRKWFGLGGLGSEPALVVNGEAAGEWVGEGWEDVQGGSGGAGSGVLGDVDPNVNSPGGVYANGSANGAGSGKKDKDKEKAGKGGTWFGKRRSFRLGEKALKGIVRSEEPEAALPPSPAVLRTSLHLPKRQEAEYSSTNEQERPASSPVVQEDEDGHQRSKHRLRPLSTGLKHPESLSHLHPHAARVHGHGRSSNGDVSPSHSSSSSFDSASLGNSTPTSAVPPSSSLAHSSSGQQQSHTDLGSNSHSHHHTDTHSHHRPRGNPHSHPPPRPPSSHSAKANRYPTPPPRMNTSLSTPPASASSTTPTTMTTPTPTPGSATNPSFARTLPEAPRSPATPERKKSLANFPVFRSRDKDKDKERGKEKERLRDAVRPATAGPEVGRQREREREREGERRLPPVPPLPATTGQQRHRRTGSVLGGGEVEEPVSMPVATDGAEKLPSALDAPVALASIGSGNTSVASNSGSSGGMGFRRATRKLSLTAPMLGFGKREKDKEKEREKEKEKGSKAAPSSFTWV